MSVKWDQNYQDSLPYEVTNIILAEEAGAEPGFFLASKLAGGQLTS